MQTKKRLLIASLSQQKTNNDLINDLKFLMKITAIMVATISVCVVAGFWLDQRLSLGRVGLIVGAVVGFVSGIWIGWNVLRKYSDKRYE